MIKNVTIFITEPICACGTTEFNMIRIGNKFEVSVSCPKCKSGVKGFPSFLVETPDTFIKKEVKNLSKEILNSTDITLNSGDPPWKK
jgi:hypothetical protein